MRNTRWAWMRRGALASALVLLVSLGAGGSRAEADPAPTYTAVLMSSPGRGNFEVSENGNPINGAGLVAGSVLVKGRHRAALFNTRTGNVYELNGLRTDCETWAVDVNVHNHVVGYQECTPQSFEVGFYWSSSTAPVRYIDSSPTTFSRPSALNDLDVVVGYHSVGGGYSWSAATGKLVFMTNAEGDEAHPYAVNNGGYATGTLIRHGQPLALFWIPEKKKLISLGTPPNWGGATGDAINDRGYIVLRRVSADAVYVWSPVTQKLEQLPTGEVRVIPSAINAGGVVVGSLDLGRRSPVVWDTCGGPYRVLPQPSGSEEQLLYGINIYGRIVGNTVLPDPDPLVLRFSRGTWWDRPVGERQAVKLPCRS